jgi:DNA-binding NarL/FixJ family response regulator
MHRGVQDDGKEGRPAQPVAPAAGEPCTPREFEVLRLAADGCPRCEVARRLGIDETTVQFHLHNMFEKLHAGSTIELVQRARQRGWLE